MIQKITYSIIIIVLFGYQSISQNQNTLIIDLKTENNPNIDLSISRLNYTLTPLDKFPILNNQVKTNYKGIPLNDSISYFGNFESSRQLYYDLYRDKVFEKEAFLDLIKKNQIDTLELSKKPLIQGFISVIGFYKNKQFIIADVNRNKDFNDDIKYEFSINFRKKAIDSIEKINKLPYINYSFENYLNGKIYIVNKKLVLYPSTNETYPTEDVKYNKLEFLSKYKFIDYWKGSATINNKKIEFYYQGLDNFYGATFIKPKNVSFSKKDNTFNDQFIHYTGDTITIENNYYLIDSINKNITKLYLRKLKRNSLNYGSSIGNQLKNYQLDDINGKPFNTNEIINKSKYTLLDFWSTTCAPCIKMMPLLQKTQSQFSSTFNIISVTKDRDINKVKSYIDKNKITWKNAMITFITPISKDLNINYLPTLILIDSNGKIVYRGSDEREVLKFIK